MEFYHEYLEKHVWFYEIIALFVFVIVFNLSMRIVIPYLERSRSIWRKTFYHALISPLTFYIWFFAIVASLMLLDHSLHETPFFTEYGTVYALGAIVAISWFTFRWKKGLVKKFYNKSSQQKITMSAQQIDALDKLVTLIIAFLTATALFETSGYGVATFLTLGGVGVAAVGFASKEFIANFFGGFMIYLTKPFSIGDVVKIPQRNVEGIVEEIGWYMTQVRDWEKQPIFIPNSTFSEVIIITPSKRSHRRILEVIGVRYQDIQSIPKIVDEIKQYLVDHPKLDHEQRQAVNFTSYGDSSLNIEIFTYTQVIDVNAFNQIKQETLLTIAEIVKKHGADFPFPTITLDTPNPVPVKE